MFPTPGATPHIRLYRVLPTFQPPTLNFAKVYAATGGAFIALFVFCPALIPVIIPIAGRLLAFCVGRFPALAGSAGVVSVKAFDALIEAIEQTRASNNDAPARFGNQLPAAHPTQELFLNLSRKMDAAHKALVRQRKSALHLDR